MSSLPENVVLGNTLGGVAIDIICSEVIPEQLPKLALIPSLLVKFSLPEKVNAGKYLGNLEADITWETVRFEHFSMFTCSFWRVYWHFIADLRRKRYAYKSSAI